MTPAQKLDANLGLSARELVVLAPCGNLTERAIHRRFAPMVAAGSIVPGRLGRTAVYPAWAIRRYIFGDTSAHPPGGGPAPEDAAQESA